MFPGLREGRPRWVAQVEGVNKDGTRVWFEASGSENAMACMSFFFPPGIEISSRIGRCLICLCCLKGRIYFYFICYMI